MALLRLRTRALALVLVLSLGIVGASVAAGPAAAATCKSRGQKVITQRQLIIYYVQSSTGQEYRGCDVKTGRVTRLVTKGQSYATEQIVAHGRHATVVEAIDPFGTSETQKKVVTNWNLAKGKPYAALEIDAEFERSRAVPELFDDVLGDPVTAVTYVSGGKRVLDVVSNKGTRRLSEGGVKPKSVKVSGRVVRWTEGSTKKSKKV